MSTLKTRFRRVQPVQVVWLLIGLYVLFFALNSIQIHRALQTHTADLGQIDLAVWNTSRGRFVQEIKGELISTRLTDHVEPIWLPVSLIYWLWNDVRSLLILQTITLAIGAWPLYLIARRRIRVSDSAFLQEDFERTLYRDRVFGVARGSSRRGRALQGWGPVFLAFIYLMYPALQAANLTEVHAIAFAAPLILFALWFIDSGRWIKFAVVVILLALVKEEAALLAAVLGMYGFWRALSDRSPVPDALDKSPPPKRWRSALVLTAGVTIVSLVWFVAATFVIVPSYAADVYDSSESTYFQRYGPLGESAADIGKAIVTRPGDVWVIASTPGRIRYLVGLMLATGGLALFGPEILLLSLPILLANVLSTFEAQWSGELHYSAPLAAYFMGAAAYGLHRLAQLFSRRRLLRPAKTGTRVGLIALFIALSYHIFAGSTPIGLNFRWPAVGEHEQSLNRFVEQIPADAPLAATTALVPHVSHREYIYKLPNLGNAKWVLADVSGTTDMHAAALQAQLRQLIDEGWGVVDAEDGYMLLSEERVNTLIPNNFYDFARVGDSDQLILDQSMQAHWPGGAVYLGYRLEDQPKWGLTHITHYVQTGDIPLSPYFFVASAEGDIADNSVLRPPPALQWYNQTRWQPGEILAFKSAWFMPDLWRPGIAFSESEEIPSAAVDPTQRLIPTQITGESTWEWHDAALWLQPWQRPGKKHVLEMLDDTASVDLDRLRPPEDGASVWLQTSPASSAPGQDISFRLGWLLDTPFDQDYMLFVHILDNQGQRLAQTDRSPYHFFSIPSSTWPEQLPVITGHSVHVPADLSPGAYDILVGLYDPATNERVPLAGIDAKASDAIIVGQLQVRRGDGVTATLGQ